MLFKRLVFALFRIMHRVFSPPINCVIAFPEGLGCCITEVAERGLAAFILLFPGTELLAALRKFWNVRTNL